MSNEISAKALGHNDSNALDEIDAFRAQVMRELPSTNIVDSSYYGVDTFAMCEMNSYILITQPVYQDIHPNLVIIPLQTDISMPYGLIYAKEPTAATLKFIRAVSDYFCAMQ